MKIQWLWQWLTVFLLVNTIKLYLLFQQINLDITYSEQGPTQYVLLIEIYTLNNNNFMMKLGKAEAKGT